MKNYMLNFTRVFSDKDVFFSDLGSSSIGPSALRWLDELARCNEDGKARICCHNSYDDLVQEMFIVIRKGAYIPPHKHPSKNESIHVTMGEADLLYFNEDGEIVNILSLGKEAELYCRIPENVFHTLVIRSESFGFHEIIPGPFRQSQTIHASWAPSFLENRLVNDYMVSLEEQVNQWALPRP